MEKLKIAKENLWSFLNRAEWEINDGIEFFQDKNDPDTQKSIDAIKEYYKKFLSKGNKVASNEEIVRDKLKREIDEVNSNVTALYKELKQTNLNKKDISLMISWAYDALGRAFKVIKTLDTKLVK